MRKQSITFEIALLIISYGTSTNFLVFMADNESTNFFSRPISQATFI